jgi:hypothetical protein
MAISFNLNEVYLGDSQEREKGRIVQISFSSLFQVSAWNEKTTSLFSFDIKSILIVKRANYLFFMPSQVIQSLRR